MAQASSAQLDALEINPVRPTLDQEPARRGMIEITPELLQEDALVVSHVSKRFYKQRSLTSKLWGLRPWSQQENGKKHGRVVRAVDDVTVTVKRREIFGLLGSNGSGKSTFIRLLSTLLEPDEGTVAIFGYDIQKDERAVQRLINRVSVDAAFFKKLSPYENLIYAARLYGMPGPQARKEIYELLLRLGIKRDRISQSLENMSRGMQQKVAIARAFLTAPVLLLLDEPTTGLDPRSKEDVQVFVRELRDTHDATILLTTHDMDEADALCDRIAIIDGGRIVAMDTPAALKRQVALAQGKDGLASLHDVFMHFTGRNWEEYEDEEDGESDD
jgi:ABC-2 type transport system ATP-binding protein